MIRTIPFLVLFLFFCNVKKNEQPKISNSDRKEPEMLLLKLTWFEGEVEITRGNSKIIPKPELELEKEDLIKTGQNGNLELLLGLDHSIKIGSNSEVSITNLLKTEGDTATNISLLQGTILTAFSKEKKDNLFTLVTPNILASLDGSTILAQAIPNDKKVPCSKETCKTKIISLDGNVHLKQPGSSSDLVMEKKFQILISNEKDLSQNMITPIDKSSLSILKNMLYFHGEDHSISPEIIGEFSNVTEAKTTVSPVKTFVQKKTVIAKKTSPKPIKVEPKKKNLTKDIHRNKLKLNSNQGF